MKNYPLLLIGALIIIAGAFSSCEKVVDGIQDSVEVTIYTDLEAPFTAVPDVAKATKDGSSTFSETAIIDMSNNEDLEDYLESIQSVEVTKIKVMITSTSPSGLALESGFFSITDDVNGDSFGFATPANMPINVGAQFEIGSDAPGWDTVNSIIASLHSATVNANGTINNDTF